MDEIGADFGIPAEMRDEIGQVLEFGASEYACETERAAHDFERIRKELHALDQAAKSLLNALANISLQTQRILHEAGVGRSLKGFDLPRVTGTDNAPLLHYAASPNQQPLSIPLADIGSILAALGQCAIDARPAARASRKGRPEQQGLWDLLHMGFQVWASVLGRPFKLDWASDGHPITDAAQFSVRIAHVVDQSLTLQQIATASRKVREMSFQVSNLAELPNALEHYRKQFE
ncbi:hypothetical protein [Roseinatronobacter sp. S2]|uniref:hypothetical protein n=1 Tax=Roseinatronobacter sp. S2 TaxID=3035471 RepID=UPI00240FB9D6|nr:hypothetical protein [Roseinatronobacter sp. S2]WFE75752.1 hypothetical protein P8S53_04905 [Roseinatronobacter sp. S2]